MLLVLFAFSFFQYTIDMTHEFLFTVSQWASGDPFCVGAILDRSIMLFAHRIWIGHSGQS